eukprot:TRINITY_DN2932_c0_g1_i1.p1 TRINITY_DN2932_c0_g1~~TRINITY_DN2932_c0_g1_i1.p1  ORF type:complete len:559 (+),score=99.11 TRINITY_DN2932_c0_g1_i1:204-1679(+)
MMAPSSSDPTPACGSAEATEANIDVLTGHAHSDDPRLQLSAAVNFRKLLSQDGSPPIDEIVRADGVVKRLVSFLGRDENSVLQFESAWALTNIASGTSEHTRVVIHNRAVPEFIRLLGSRALDVSEQAAWALGNIAGDGHKFRDVILSEGAMAPLLDVVQRRPSLTLLRTCAWTISNLCRGKPPPMFAYIAPALPTLAMLLYHEDMDVVGDACWAMSYISDGPNEQIQAVIDAEVTPRVIELLVHPGIQTPALRIIGNFVTGDDRQTQQVINAGCLVPLRTLLSHPRRTIRKEACWTISNITAGPTGQVQAAIDANIFPPLLDLLRDGEFDVRKEAAWAVSNATSASHPPHVAYFVQIGVVPLYLELLNLNDARVVTVALEGIDNILRAGQEADEEETGANVYAEHLERVGGLRAIEDLTLDPSPKNQAIAEKARDILETYFEEREDDFADVDGWQPEAAAQPSAQEGHQAFPFGLQEDQPPMSFGMPGEA